MSIAAIICDGLGPGASIANVIRDGFSSVIPNTQTMTCTGVSSGGLSLADNQSPAVAAGDIFVVPLKTPTGYNVTVDGTGHLTIDAHGDTTRQQLLCNIFDTSLSAYFGAFTVFINNHAPAILIQPADILVLVGNSIPTINFTGGSSPYVADQDGDTLVASLVGGSIADCTLTGNVLSGAPDQTVKNPITIRFTDPIGAFTDLTMNFEVQAGIFVPDLTDFTLGEVQSALVAAGLGGTQLPPVSSLTIAAGRVVSQSPAATSLVFSGTLISYTLSLGPQGTFVPEPPSLGGVGALSIAGRFT